VFKDEITKVRLRINVVRGPKKEIQQRGDVDKAWELLFENLRGKNPNAGGDVEGRTVGDSGRVGREERKRK